MYMLLKLFMEGEGEGLKRPDQIKKIQGIRDRYISFVLHIHRYHPDREHPTGTRI